MTEEDIIRTIGRLIEEGGIPKREINLTSLLEGLERSPAELIDALIHIVYWKERELYQQRTKYLQLEREKELKEEMLNRFFKNNVEKQRSLIQEGLPIANKKYSLIEVKWYLESGYTDAEIMELLDISRTTMWRIRKKLDAEK